MEWVVIRGRKTEGSNEAGKIVTALNYRHVISIEQMIGSKEGRFLGEEVTQITMKDGTVFSYPESKYIIRY